jgi:CRISPR-associated protein Cas5d
VANEFFNKRFCIEVWGDYACFTRPEMKVERVSYDVITPSAGRAIFEAIFWKPAVRWRVKMIEVLAPIRWISVRRNEVSFVASSPLGYFVDDIDDSGKPKWRQQRAGLLLRDVRYRLHAELEFIPPARRAEAKNPTPDWLQDATEHHLLRSDENPGKYNSIFERRARKGQCFNQPYLGCREFSCHFRFEENPAKAAMEVPPIKESRDLGFMLYDIDFSSPDGPQPAFFRPKLVEGAVQIPDWESEEVHR